MQLCVSRIPNRTYLGDPLGVAGDERTRAANGPADAVRTLNLTRHSVAGFRPRAPENRLTMPATLSQARPMIRTGWLAVPVSGDLFRALAPNQRGAASQQAGGVLDRATLRRRQVSVDIERLARVPGDGSTTLRLNLFEDVVLLGIIQRRTPTYSGGFCALGPAGGRARRNRDPGGQRERGRGHGPHPRCHLSHSSGRTGEAGDHADRSVTVTSGVRAGEADAGAGSDDADYEGSEWINLGPAPRAFRQVAI